MPHPGLHSQTIRSPEETEQSLRTSKNPELSWTFAYKTQTTARVDLKKSELAYVTGFNPSSLSFTQRQKKGGVGGLGKL